MRKFIKFKTQYTLYADELINRYNTIYNQRWHLLSIFFKGIITLKSMYIDLNILNHLCSIETQNFLKLYDYKLNNLDDMLNHLKYRFQLLGRTPHEIGLFLGYPLCDVKGFIYNNGKNYKFSGPWKVYDNESETILYFDKCKQC
ncbi:MAG: DUF3793 family protein, partial [Intestinibacter sp.]